jgi:light-regulated signal transduction histidine kinase (bacteriophytochrome)
VAVVIASQWLFGSALQAASEANRDLRVARERLEATNRELERFSYSISHDLRAPLRAINGYSRMLEEDCGQALNERGRKHLEQIQDATARMAEQIEALLRLSRITQSELSLQPTDLSRMAEGILAELAVAEPGRRVTWKVSPALTAECDARLVHTLLQNLLENAWKYTARQPEATIEFGVTSDARGLVFHVRDNGVGFDMAYAARLFGAFQRLHGSAEYPGLGIGLATVQRIVHRHGGLIWAEAVPGQGATFHFTLGPEGGRGTAIGK